MVETQDLNTMIAKYYLADQLFVFQVEELLDLLTRHLTVRFPHHRAVNKANYLVAKYYLNMGKAKVHRAGTRRWERQTENPARLLNADKQSTKPACFGSLTSTCSNCTFYIQCLQMTAHRDLVRGF
ncbi:MAG: hypothetical protein JSV87_03345 [Candidatus Bathyarchaeota archaeon]|nr:MAG: hypothetical protein JSV87_03345 [Candidatus Bathyarchaeota archaeon]